MPNMRRSAPPEAPFRTLELRFGFFISLIAASVAVNLWGVIWGNILGW